MRYEIEVDVKKYMQHRMDDQKLDEWEKKRGRIIERAEVHEDDEKRALFHSYCDDDGFFVPSEHILQSLILAGTYLKAKVGNAKKSMANIVAGSFNIVPEKLRCLDKKFTVDKRTAVNQNIKARVIVIRPRWDNFKIKFTIENDNDTITDETIKELLDISGNNVGIGSYRPQRRGSFGRYKVTSFKKLKE